MTPKKPMQKILLNPKEFFDRLRKKQISYGFLALYVFVSLVFLGIASVGVVYLVYLRTLPSISSIEDITLPESSVIRDRNGKELYSLFSGQDGKRTYVEIGGISQNMIDAIVSTEDKTFFENDGVDFRGLVRSGWNFITGKTDKIQGTSTISQQLIKNTFLSNERSVDRKAKEIYLSYRLNSKYSKEKILELYLNKISFGNNASGIEEAAKTYFGKSAKDVKVLGSTILASLPKGPTYFSPYSHRDRLMGYLYVFKDGKTDEKITLSNPETFRDYRPLVESFKKFVSGLQIERIDDSDAKVCGLDATKLKNKYSIDAKGCSRLAYKDLLQLLNDIQLAPTASTGALVTPVAAPTATGSSKPGTKPAKPSTSTGSTTPVLTQAQKLEGYVLEYNTGRKDFVASRMLEDGKITPEEFKAVIIDGLEFQFVRNAQNMKYPHFVTYVQDYLTKKYGDDFFDQGGLQIYTTIDPKLQDKAEELVARQVKINKDKYGATSAALVSLDNKTGQIVSMVGGPDYFGDAEQGKVNMITSLRQPGSSFKPIVYALAMSKEAISPDTPIFDVDTTFGKWNPDNYDQKFMGKMKVRTALDYSRNIPAIKMFAVAGGEAAVVKHARSLGALSLRENGNYGMPLAIGTGEVKPIELMEAYSVFANGGWKKEPTPVLKIVDKKGNVIDEYVESNGKYIFSDAASYLLSVIISDASSRPSAFWNNVLTLKDRPVAAKTGTSNKDVTLPGKEKKILPRDLWTAGYTPQYTTIVWAGNVDGTETKGTCDGLNCAAPIWHDYMEYAHKGLPVMQFKKPDSVYSATISSISGKLASENTPSEYKITSIFAVKPTKYENSAKQVEVDALCNGKITDATPKAAIRKGFLIDIDPIIESYDSSWVSATRRWATSEAGNSYFSSGSTLITSYSDKICERPGVGESQVTVSLSLPDGSKRPLGKWSIQVSFQAANPIVKIQLDRDGEVFKETAVESLKDGTITIGDINFDTAFSGEHEIGVTAIDQYGYSGRSSARVTFGGQVQGSNITVDNPKDADPRIAIYEGQFFNLKFHVDDPVALTAVNVYIDDELYKLLWSDERSFSVPVGSDLAVGTHTVEIRTINDLRGRAARSVIVEVLAK